MVLVFVVIWAIIFTIVSCEQSERTFQLRCERMRLTMIIMLVMIWSVVFTVRPLSFTFRVISMIITFVVLLPVILRVVSAVVTLREPFVHDQSVLLVCLMDGLPSALAVIDISAVGFEVFIDGVFLPSPGWSGNGTCGTTGHGKILDLHGVSLTTRLWNQGEIEELL